MRGSLTRQLADIAARPIDQATLARATLHVLDWIGCAALGGTAEAGRVLATYGRDQPKGACLAFGAGRRDASTAAFVNGGLGNLFELDDLHRTSIVHPGDVVVPAALAAAERDGAAGPAFLDAVVRGYEVAIRVGIAAGRAHYRYWYNTATCGVFGAAAAVASLHGLDRERTVDALGQAGQQAAGLWQCRIEPTHSKQLATAHAAQAGLVAADLARVGLRGAHRILEGSHGFFAAACPDAEPELALADADGPWKLFDTSFKPWPACRHAHPAIEAALALRDGVETDRIAHILTRTYREAVEFCDKPAPVTSDDARFSLQHCVAIALLRGAPTLADFEVAAITDRRVAALRNVSEVKEDAGCTDAFPSRYGAGVTVRMEGGIAHEATVEAAKGDPENPMTEDEIAAKARVSLAAAGTPQRSADRLLAACLDLADGGKISAVTASVVG